MSCKKQPGYWMKGSLDANSSRIVAMFLIKRLDRFASMIHLFCDPDSSLTYEELQTYVAAFCHNMRTDLRSPEDLCHALNLQYDGAFDFTPELFGSDGEVMPYA